MQTNETRNRLLALASPGGGLRIQLYATPEGRLQFDVSREGAVVIEPSDLGIAVDGADLGAGCEPGQPAARTVRDTYPARGGHRTAVNHYNECSLPLLHGASGIAYELQIRAYEDGAAYRYVVPGEGRRTVNGEASSWRIPAGSAIWLFERNNDWKLKSYAGEYIKAAVEQLPTLSGQGPLQGTPLVIGLPGGGGYAVIMEAALYRYSGMRLEAVGDRVVRADFTEGDDGFEVDGPIVSPWRVTLCCPDLNGLVGSDLPANLNPAPSPGLFPDTAYIKPGRSVWRWWSLGTGTPAEEREMIGHAAELGYEYTTVDEGWELWPNPWDDLRELTRYGSGLNVGVFVWKRSKEIDGPAGDWRELRRFLDLVRDAGAVGVKIDFIDNESKAAIDFEIAALQLAAERRLMVNFHGISKPTGESRTYPNEISREGIRGLELNKMREGPIPAWHNAALPFTRFLAGHGDYTPVGFSNPGPTTPAHQLATAIVFTSPLQVIAEHPRYLLEERAAAPALDLLKRLPTVWDETRVLAPSAIGELAAFARRSGGDWYVALLNGTDRTVRIDDVDLSFLDDCRYEAEWIDDEVRGNAEPICAAAALRRIAGTVDGASAKLDVQLLPAGGFVARYRRAT